MDEQEYKKKLDKIFVKMLNQLGKLQEKLTPQEVVNYSVQLDMAFIMTFSNLVGEKSIVHYLINLLSKAGKIDWERRNLSIDQFARLQKPDDGKIDYAG